MSTEALAAEAQEFERIWDSSDGSYENALRFFRAGRDLGLELRGSDARDVAVIARLVAALRGHGCDFRCYDDGPDGPNTEICGKRALLTEVRSAYALGEEGAE